jgi:hypothetical protein
MIDCLSQEVGREGTTRVRTPDVGVRDVFVNFVNFNRIASNRRGGVLWCCNVIAYDVLASALRPSSTSNKV